MSTQNAPSALIPEPSLAVRNINIEPALKLLFVAPLAVIGSFLLARLIILIPGVKKII